jgi:hypothetical protein
MRVYAWTLTYLLPEWGGGVMTPRISRTTHKGVLLARLSLGSGVPLNLPIIDMSLGLPFFPDWGRDPLVPFCLGVLMILTSIHYAL